MKRAKIITLPLTAVILSLLLAACSDPTGEKEMAVFTINLGGSSGRAAIYPPGAPVTFPTFNDLEYVLTLTPISNGSAVTITKPRNNNDTITGTIAAGEYSVALDIYLIFKKKDNTTDDKLLYATGGAWDPAAGISLPSVTIAAGVTNTIDVEVHYYEGSGAPGDPIKICDEDALARIGMGTSTSWVGDYTYSAEYILIRNITLTSPWTPIGVDWTSPFEGVFDGNGKTITGLNISSGSNDYQGLFGYVEGNGTTTGIVKDLTLKNVSISVTGDNVGGVVGYSDNGTIKGCSVTGTGSVTGNMFVGGVAGYNYNGGVVENCSVTLTGGVSGYCRVGGVAGNSVLSTVKNCSVTGTGGVSADAFLGGVVGYNEDGTVDSCFSTVNVNSTTITDCYAGGVVGWNESSSADSTVKNCYATGNVNCSTGNLVGGVVGYNSSTGCNSIVQNCYATGAVLGNNSVGGVVGRNVSNDVSTVQDCYATGAVSGNNEVGGVVGFNRGRNGGTGTVQNCYATGAVSGSNSVGGVVGGNDSGTLVPGIGAVENCVALNSSISVSTLGRVCGVSTATVGGIVRLSNNYGRDEMPPNTSPGAWPSNTESTIGGVDITSTQWGNEGWWQNPSSPPGNGPAFDPEVWDFESLDGTNLPILRDMPDGEQDPTI